MLIARLGKAQCAYCSVFNAPSFFIAPFLLDSIPTLYAKNIRFIFFSAKAFESLIVITIKWNHDLIHTLIAAFVSRIGKENVKVYNWILKLHWPKPYAENCTTVRLPHAKRTTRANFRSRSRLRCWEKRNEAKKKSFFAFARWFDQLRAGHQSERFG